MNDNASTFVPLGTALDALLIKIRRQMDARIAAEKVSGTTAKAAGSTQRRGAA